eukprot:Rhum_TRINITY_DN14547_c13_g2::Rhum_TRINITY_DN14547_c13_g2_i1::g.96448::m.96448
MRFQRRRRGKRTQTINIAKVVKLSKMPSDGACPKRRMTLGNRVSMSRPCAVVLTNLCDRLAARLLTTSLRLLRHCGAKTLNEKTVVAAAALHASEDLSKSVEQAAAAATAEYKSCLKQKKSK